MSGIVFWPRRPAIPVIVRPRSGRRARSSGWPGRAGFRDFRCRSGAGTRRYQAGWLRYHRRTGRLARSGAGSGGAEHRQQTLRPDRGSRVRFTPKNRHRYLVRPRPKSANSGLKSDIVSRPFGARFGHLSITRILINSKSRCSRSRRPRQQSGLALAGNPDHANGLGTERREGVAQWRAGNLHQTRKWLTQLQD